MEKDFQEMQWYENILQLSYYFWKYVYVSCLLKF